MSSPYDSIATLSRALDQTGDVLAAIHRDQLSDATPCEDWDVAHLIGHVLGAPGRFAAVLSAASAVELVGEAADQEAVDGRFVCLGRTDVRGPPKHARTEQTAAEQSVAAV